MSASLFADMYIDYGNSPTNYIEYNKGEKKFGELQKGDEIYLYDNILFKLFSTINTFLKIIFLI